ncbi:MAG: fatty acid desaturase [Pirellula sp.]
MLRDEANVDTPNQQFHQHHSGPMVASTQPQVEEVAPANLRSTRSSSKESPVPTVWNLQIGATIFLLALHIGAVFAPWTFTWSGLALAVFMHWLTGSIGICLGFHRLLTHTGLVVPAWLGNTFATIGCMAGEGGPISWTANHRKHHAYSDQPGDPHSPHDGPWWAHAFWLAFSTDNGDPEGYARKWVPDLMKNKFLVFLEKAFLPLHIVFGAMVTAAGYAIGGPSLAASWFVWVVCLRMVAVLHTTWFVNSASHIWGYRNYKTTDDSRNLWWVAIIAYGEGWHNNHHAHPRLAQHGHKWWEFDMTYMVIRLLKAVGLAKEVVDLKSMEEKKQRHAERAAA